MAFKVSTRGQNAVLLMYELTKSDGAYVSLARIASKQNVSQGYLEQIVGPLRDTGLVVSRRGSGGGYALAKPAADITVGQIVRAVEGPVTPVRCVVGGAPDSCPEDCQARAVWMKVSEAIDSALDSFTLENLVNR